MKNTGLTLMLLPKHGVSYAAEELAKGGPLAANLQIGDGEVFSFLPSGLELASTDYREGGVLSPEQASEAEDAMAWLIRTFLERTPSNIALFEDRSFKLDDRVVADDDYVFECEGVLYHFRNAETGAEDAIGLASPYPTIVLLATTAAELPRRTSITQADLHKAVTDVRHAVVGAYDEEGYVLWTRHLAELQREG